jgi:glutaredoxin 3
MKAEVTKVKIYSTPTCPYCLAAKDFFKEQAIEFQDFNVMENAEAKKEAIKKSGGMSIPVIDINGQIIVGFDKEKIQGILENEKQEPTKEE